jgi:hypothetical protein
MTKVVTCFYYSKRKVSNVVFMKRIGLLLFVGISSCHYSSNNQQTHIDSVGVQIVALEKENLKKEDSVKKGNLNDSSIREISKRAILNEVKINELKMEVSKIEKR